MEERLTLVGLNGRKEGAVLSPKQDLHASLTRGNAYVNGTQITISTKLKLGDHIQIGEDKFILAPHNFKLDDNSLSVLAINGPNRGKRVLLDATKRIKHENDYVVLTPLHVQDDNTSHVEVTPTGRVSSQGKQLTRTTLMQHGHQLTIGTNTYIILPKNKTQTPNKPDDHSSQSKKAPNATRLKNSTELPSVLVNQDYEAQVQQRGTRLAKVDLFDAIRDSAAMFMFGRINGDLRDYHTIFHHFGKNVKRNSTVRAERMGSDLHAKISDVMKITIEADSKTQEKTHTSFTLRYLY